MVEVHRVRRLEDRLADDGRDLVLVRLHRAQHRREVRRVPFTAKRHGRLFGKEVVRHDVAKEHVHAIGIRKRHCERGVAVVPALQRRELRAPRTPLRPLVLHGHLRGHLHGDRPRVREKHAVEARRRTCGEPLGQLNRRFVRETAEHDMAHPLALATNRLDDRRMVVSVRHAPPAGDGVNQPPPVGEFDLHALRRARHAHGRRILQRGVRMPDMRLVEIAEPGGHFVGVPSSGGSSWFTRRATACSPNTVSLGRMPPNGR